MTMVHFIAFTIRAIPALLTPVILLAGIYTGIMTATEAGAVAAAYTLLVAIFAYRELKLKEFKALCIDTVKTIGTVSIMLGAAGGVAYIVAKEQIATNLATWITGLNVSPFLFLLLVNIVVLFLGMLLDISIINQVFLPILMPVVVALGIDIVQFGVMAVLNMMIGLATPPFGMLLFIVSGISGTPLKAVIKEILPMLGVMIVALIIITYIPDVVLFLPRLFLNYSG